MPGPFDLTGKVSLITGANTAIGRAIALALAGAGADIAAVGRTPAADTLKGIVRQPKKPVTIEDMNSAIEKMGCIP